MKKLQTAIITIGLCGAVSASAQIYTISGADFNNPALTAAYNGTYESGSGGYMHLAYTDTDPAGDAVVGAVGPLGTLANLSMSFEYSNLTGTCGTPFAAFGVSVDGVWGGSAYRYNIISMEGNQLTGTTRVHVWDWNLNSGNGADVPGLGQSDNVTLNDVLSALDSYDATPFGDLEVMRAYAYIGDTGGTSSGSVDITSMTVITVPEPGTLTMMAGAFLLLAVSLRRRRNRIA